MNRHQNKQLAWTDSTTQAQGAACCALCTVHAHLPPCSMLSAALKASILAKRLRITHHSAGPRAPGQQAHPPQWRTRTGAPPAQPAPPAQCTLQPISSELWQQQHPSTPLLGARTHSASPIRPHHSAPARSAPVRRCLCFAAVGHVVSDKLRGVPGGGCIVRVPLEPACTRRMRERHSAARPLTWQPRGHNRQRTSLAAPTGSVRAGCINLAVCARTCSTHARTRAHTCTTFKHARQPHLRYRSPKTAAHTSSVPTNVATTAPASVPACLGVQLRGSKQACGDGAHSK